MKRWSALPLYAVAVVWILWAWLLPLYEVWHYVLLLVASVLTYGLLASVCNNNANNPPLQAEGEEPKAKKEEPKQPDPKPETKKKPSTGNPDLDKLILDRDRAVSEMRRLNDNIPDAALSAQIDDLEVTTTKIIDHVLEHPEKLPQIRKFMNYYLPTTLKLLNVYDRMGAQGVREENIGGTMERVEQTFGRIVQAYHRQLDALFANEALDINSDITVMENLLKQEGFLDNQPSQAPSPEPKVQFGQEDIFQQMETSAKTDTSGLPKAEPASPGDPFAEVLSRDADRKQG